MIDIPILHEQAGSSVGEHRPYKPRVAGSTPAPPTIALRETNIQQRIVFYGGVVQFG